MMGRLSKLSPASARHWSVAVEHGLHAVVHAQANVGRTGRTLAENGARAIAQAGAALRAAAVDPEK